MGKYLHLYNTIEDNINSYQTNKIDSPFISYDLQSKSLIYDKMSNLSKNLLVGSLKFGLSFKNIIDTILEEYNQKNNSSIQFEYCKFVYEDKNCNILNNWVPISYEELYNFNEFTIIPYNVYYIGVCDSLLSEKYFDISISSIKTKFDTRHYRVGLLSDIHYNDTSIDADPYTVNNVDGSEYDGDLENALTFFENKEDISFMCSAGDVSTDSKEHLRNFALNLKTKSPTTPFYSCLGNHDFQATHYEVTNLHDDAGFGLTEEYLNRIQIWNEHIIPKDNTIHYFNENTDEGKLSYYIERTIPGTNKSDIYLFLSVDYGVTHATKTTKSNWDCKAAQKDLDYQDSSVISLMNYVGCQSRTELQRQYDYQFYDNDVLLWIKNIIENSNGKRIFLFTHQFFIQKAGNNNSDKYYSYAKDYWRVSQKDDSNGQIAYCLCGLQFEFLNKLNNDYKNVIWFTGHSHYSWKWQIVDKTINVCNKDYKIVDPSDNDFIKELRYLRSTTNGESKCDSAFNVHLPSLARPIPYYVNSYGVSLKSSEGAVMDVYEDYVDIRGIMFKNEDISQYIYINKYYPLAQYRIPIKAK